MCTKIKLNKNKCCWSIHYSQLPGFEEIFNELKEVAKVFVNKENIDFYNKVYNNNDYYHYEKTKTIPNKKELENYLNIEKFAKPGKLERKIENNLKKIDMLEKIIINTNDIRIRDNEKIKLLKKENKEITEQLNILRKKRMLIYNYKLDLNLETVDLNKINYKENKLIINFNKNNEINYGNSVFNFLNNKYLMNRFENLLSKYNCKISGLFWYTKKSARSWHTNFKDRCGWTLYLIYVEEENKSWFNLIHPKTKELISIPDKNGYINIFYLQNDIKNPLWHNVRSDTNRLSIGLSFKEEFINKYFEFI